MKTRATRLLPWLWLTAAIPAFGQSAPPPAKTSRERVPSRPRRVIRAEETQVEGRIQKPQAFYILQRSNLNFDELNKSEDFVPKIEKSVEKDPF